MTLKRPSDAITRNSSCRSAVVIHTYIHTYIHTHTHTHTHIDTLAFSILTNAGIVLRG